MARIVRTHWAIAAWTAAIALATAYLEHVLAVAHAADCRSALQCALVGPFDAMLEAIAAFLAVALWSTGCGLIALLGSRRC